MNRMIYLSAAPLIALATSFAAESGTTTFSGQVVDAEGNVLTEYDISTSFTWQDGEVFGEEGFTIDEEGRFTGQIATAEGDTVLVVYSNDRRFGNTLRIPSTQSGDLKIKLERTVRVSGNVTCEDLGEKPSWFNVNWSLEEVSPISVDSTNGKFDLRLPVGYWEYDLYDAWFTTMTGELPLDGRLGVVNMGKLDLPGSYIALNQGRVIEDWAPTAVKNIALDRATLKAHRGKWVLVEFWSYQYDSSTQESLPEHVKFYDRNQNRSGEFEIIAFHENTVRGFVELERYLAPVKQKFWKGRSLPFPVLLDDTGDTLRRFEVNAFPTTVLIDPQGRLIGNASLAMLQEALAGQLEVPEPVSR